MSPTKPSKAAAGGCMVLFGLPFLVAGLAVTYFYISGYVQWWEARNWEEVPCWIESAKLESRSDEGTTYKATATYRYKFDGQTYQGDRVGFQSGYDNIGSFQQEIHRELKRYAGKTQSFPCYVNPAHPEESVLNRSLRWPMHLFMSIFALTFPAVGAGLTVGSLLGLRDKKIAARLREANPGQPWHWKHCWQGSVITEHLSLWDKARSAYLVWSALIILPLLLAMLESGSFNNDKRAWLVWLLPLGWCIPAWFTLRRWRQHLVTGETWFAPSTVPVRAGSTMRGEIVLSRPLPIRGVARLRLTGTKTTQSGSGDDASTLLEEVWTHEEVVPLEMMTQNANGSHLPVQFRLPRDAPESTPEVNANPCYNWKLHLEVPGTPVRTVFEIPVFGRTESGDSQSVESAPSIQHIATEALPEKLANQRIRAAFDEAGHLQSIVCPPGRYLGIIAFMVAFDVVWTGISVFLVRSDAPIIFQIIWPFTAICIWLIILWMTLHKRTVSLHLNGLDIAHQLGPLKWIQPVNMDDITSFTQDRHMISGNKAYYQVRLTTITGRKLTVADGIAPENVAAALVRVLQGWREGYSRGLSINA